VRTLGEIEAAFFDRIDVINHFEQECTGRGRRETDGHLTGDLLVVRTRPDDSRGWRGVSPNPRCGRGSSGCTGGSPAPSFRPRPLSRHM
jgi:hypothetical protein